MMDDIACKYMQTNEDTSREDGNHNWKEAALSVYSTIQE